MDEKGLPIEGASKIGRSISNLTKIFPQIFAVRKGLKNFAKNANVFYGKTQLVENWEWELTWFRQSSSIFFARSAR